MSSNNCFLFEPNKTIVLFEYSVCELSGSKYRNLANSLDDYEAFLYERDKIVNKIKPFQVLEKVAMGDHFTFRFSTSSLTGESYVGFGTVSGYMVNVLPKIFAFDNINKELINRSLIAFIRMLDKAYRLGLPRSIYYAPSRLENIFNNGLHEALIYFFANILYNEILNGVYREYVRFESEEKFLRGKILLSRQVVKPPTRQYLLSIEYHKLSINNKLNNLLYYASLLGAKHTCLKTTRQLLNHILALLDEAKTLHPPINTSIVFNRLNKRFEKVVNLAKIIIYGFSTGLTNESTGIFFDINNVFEKYVFSLIADNIGVEKYKVLYQKTEHDFFLIKDLKGNIIRKIPQRPDITIIDKNGSPLLYMDIKYKPLEKSGKIMPDVDDIRQMYVYSRILKERHNSNTNNVVIVYPFIPNVYNSPFGAQEKPVLIGEYNIGKRDAKLFIVGINMKHLIDDTYHIPVDFTNIIKDIIEGRL